MGAGADEGNHEGAEEGPTEVVDFEVAGEAIGHFKQDRVDDPAGEKGEEPRDAEGGNRKDGKKQPAEEGVENAEDGGDENRAAEVFDVEAGEDGGGNPNRKRRDQPSDEKAHGFDLAKVEAEGNHGRPIFRKSKVVCLP